MSFRGTNILTVLTLVFVLLVVLFLGRFQRERPATRAVSQGILLLHNGTEPKGLDPHIVTGVPESNIITALIEGLVSYHPSDDALPEPGVAERWEHSEDFRKWIFHLRETARWSNGDRVTAEDFVYSFRRILTPELGAAYAEMLFVLENAEGYHRGEFENFDLVGVRALDKRTLEVTLVGPTPYFLSMLQHYSWFPIYRPTVEKFGGPANRTSAWTRPGNYMGNGPFILSEWKTNSVIKVTKSPTYWDRDRVQLNAIHFFPIDNANTDETAFMAGQSHNSYTVPLDKVSFHRRENPHLIRIEPYLGTYFYRFNVTRSPFDNATVRRALNLAVNRRVIVEKVTRAGQRPAHGFTPEGMVGYPTPMRLRFDPQRAAELLAQAGYADGRGFPKTEILINTSESHRRIAEAIQEMWRKYLHVDVSIANQEWKVYLDAQVHLDFDISRSGWIGDFLDPITFLSMFTTGNGNNNTGWSNPAYDRGIAQAQRTARHDEHIRLMVEAEELLLEELPILPIYWYTRVYMLDPRVKNWNPKLLDNRPYKYLSLQE